MPFETTQEALEALQKHQQTMAAYNHALGSAYGAQMLKVMEADVDGLWEQVARGDLSQVTGWLKEKIHRHASFMKPGELFETVCGKFDASYFTRYLTEKYTKLYQL